MSLSVDPNALFPVHITSFSQRNLQLMKNLFSMLEWALGNKRNRCHQAVLRDGSHTCQMWIRTQLISSSTHVKKYTHTMNSDSPSTSCVIVIL